MCRKHVDNSNPFKSKSVKNKGFSSKRLSKYTQYVDNPTKLFKTTQKVFSIILWINHKITVHGG